MCLNYPGQFQGQLIQNISDAAQCKDDYPVDYNSVLCNFTQTNESNVVNTKETWMLCYFEEG